MRQEDYIYRWPLDMSRGSGLVRCSCGLGRLVASAPCIRVLGPIPTPADMASLLTNDPRPVTCQVVTVMPLQDADCECHPKIRTSAGVRGINQTMGPLRLCTIVHLFIVCFQSDVLPSLQASWPRTATIRDMAGLFRKPAPGVSASLPY